MPSHPKPRHELFSRAGRIGAPRWSSPIGSKEHVRDFYGPSDAKVARRSLRSKPIEVLPVGILRRTAQQLLGRTSYPRRIKFCRELLAVARTSIERRNVPTCKS
jgi:hypothetical protein